MRFHCTLPQNLRKGESIVLPISMNQPLERGERLSSILKAFDECGYKEQVTILVCDYLNRHNCNDELESFKQGEQFIQDHKNEIQEYRVIRWKPFIDSIPQNQFETCFNKIVTKSQEGTKFYNKIKKTWEKCLSANQEFAASIKYQTEEYASILCMNEFDHLFYPKRITNGMAYLYNFIEGKKPTYHHIKISENKSKLISTSDKTEEFFIGSLKPNRNHIHVAFRALIEHMDLLLSSQELSLKAKKIFTEETENLFMTHGLFNKENEYDGLYLTDTAKNDITNASNVIISSNSDVLLT